MYWYLSLVILKSPQIAWGLIQQSGTMLAQEEQGGGEEEGNKGILWEHLGFHSQAVELIWFLL